jgi:hypothetical protein
MLHFCGYFPKLIQPVPAGPTGFDELGLVEISSVSCCVVPAPSGWIERWCHNELGFFDSIEQAESVIHEGEPDLYDIYGYRLLDQTFDDGKPGPWVPPIAPEWSGAQFESLGFDAVSKSKSSFFECSPLSCNYAARKVTHNEHCLFSSLEDAIKGAILFSADNSEPGPYYVAEVLRRRRPTRR